MMMPTDTESLLALIAELYRTVRSQQEVIERLQASAPEPPPDLAPLAPKDGVDQSQRGAIEDIKAGRG